MHPPVLRAISMHCQASVQTTNRMIGCYIRTKQLPQPMQQSLSLQNHQSYREEFHLGALQAEAALKSMWPQTQAVSLPPPTSPAHPMRSEQASSLVSLSESLLQSEVQKVKEPMFSSWEHQRRKACLCDRMPALHTVSVLCLIDAMDHFGKITG